MKRCIDIPPEVERLLEELNSRGHQAYVVGGCVRDCLMGLSPADWDIATDAHPQEVKAIFGHTVDTGIAHGTVTVMRKKKGYEITTFRRDGTYSDGRHPDAVEFGTDLAADLSRRDFTVNAMAYSRREGLVDLFGGIKDLERKRIVCVGRSEDRFREDGLRIIRALRFCAQLNFSLEEECKKAMQSMAWRLQSVSKERIFSELTKILMTDHPEKIALAFSCELYPYISEGFRHIPPPQKMFIQFASSLPMEKAVRWSAFFVDTTVRNALAALKELKSDNRTIEDVKALLGNLSYRIQPEARSIKGLLYRIGPEKFDLLLSLFQMLEPEKKEWHREILEKKEQILLRREAYRIEMLAIHGGDLIKEGFKPGPEIGKLLEKSLETVMEHPEWNTKERLLSLCRPQKRDTKN